MKDKIALISRPKGYDYFNNSRSKQNDVLTHTKEECIAGVYAPEYDRINNVLYGPSMVVLGAISLWLLRKSCSTNTLSNLFS